MSEQKTAQKQVREQFHAIENTAQNVLHAWNDLSIATTEMAFDATDRSLRYSQDVRAQSERAFHDALVIYRQMYQDGMKSWQGYLQGVSEIFNRSL